MLSDTYAIRQMAVINYLKQQLILMSFWYYQQELRSVCTEGHVRLCIRLRVCRINIRYWNVVTEHCITGRNCYRTFQFNPEKSCASLTHYGRKLIISRKKLLRFQHLCISAYCYRKGN